MKIFDLFTEAEFNQQLADKMVKVQKHPSEPLSIVNYTQVAQFNPEKWNHVTDLCRGLIYNHDTLDLVARPFVKFWNYGDTRHPETLPENQPFGKPLITRKMDGSLGIGYRDGLGRWAVASRGSFVSDQAEWATGWLPNDFVFPYGYTPLFEIIYPENRIVVDYKGWSGLTLLAGVRINTGEELTYFALKEWASINSISVVTMFDKPMDACVSEDDDEEEGYVAAWHRPGTSPLRVKIKFATYCKLHKVLTTTSAIGIWELLRDGKSTADVFAHTPAEFQQWVRQTENRLSAFHTGITDEVKVLYALAPKTDSRKEFAEYAKSTQYPHLLFAKADGKDLAPLIWKMLRPTGDVRPFRGDE